jgi:hypothetical protein
MSSRIADMQRYQGNRVRSTITVKPGGENLAFSPGTRTMEFVDRRVKATLWRQIPEKNGERSDATQG